MKDKISQNNFIYGFACVGYSPVASKLIYSECARMHLHIIRLKVKGQNKYVCTGMNAFNRDKIPAPYNKHEFSEFYVENPPEITNNKEKAVNSLVQSILVN